MSGRDTPPDIQQGPYGYEPGSISNFEETPGAGPDALSPETAKKIGREIFQSSTNWINSGRRAAWNDSLRAFQGKFPTGSKYLSRDYVYRSALYRPKTRSMVRNDEAATAAAFFSNDDVVNIRPGDEDDEIQKASADLMQQLLQYRLTKTIPWFLTLVGARQDADTMGLCVGKADWVYEEEFSHTEERPMLNQFGMPTNKTDTVDVMKKSKDEPRVNLLALENIRFEPGADWRDVVKSSPYLIEMIPMYIQDIEDKMDAGEWKHVNSNALREASDLNDDVTRRSREQGRVPGKDNDAWKPRAFDICWVKENIVRWKGADWHFFSVGDVGELLTDPRPLKEVYLHGERPYVIGFVILETHKTYPSSKIEIVQDLQRAANDDWNLRFDNVKLTLNPRQFVKTGYGMEQQDLRTFAPGKIVLVNAPKDVASDQVITWDRPPAPDASAYAEQDRINLDFDELAGGFSNSSVQASQIQQQSATGMHLMSGVAAGMNEYELRVFAESWVEPMIRLLVKLEQAYETDPVVLALAGRNAQLFQKYGLNQITDELLNQELTTRVNVGIGATNPSLKMRNLEAVAAVAGKIFGPIAAQGVKFDETMKELFGLAGYKDGERFLVPDFDPAAAMAAQAKGKQPAGPQSDPQRLQIEQIKAQSRIQEQQMQDASDARSDQMETQRVMLQGQSELERERLKALVAAHQTGAAHGHALHLQSIQPHPALAGFGR